MKKPRALVKTVQVLVATMNSDSSLLQQMNIQSDCIIGNQCDATEVKCFEHNQRNIRWLSFNERGVGLNRNNALMRATGDVILFADDDMVFEDGYEQRVLDVFNANPKADLVIFNLKEKSGTRRQIKRKHYTKKIGYGAARIAARREIISMNNVYFNQNFGGGSTFSCGEDTIFLSECLKKKMKVLCVPDAIATLVDTRPSTWFRGYNEKYFFDRGVLLAATGVSFVYFRILKYVFFSKIKEIKKSVILRCYLDGIRYYRNL